MWLCLLVIGSSPVKMHFLNTGLFTTKLQIFSLWACAYCTTSSSWDFIIRDFLVATFSTLQWKKDKHFTSHFLLSLVDTLSCVWFHLLLWTWSHFTLLVGDFSFSSLRLKVRLCQWLVWYSWSSNSYCFENSSKKMMKNMMCYNHVDKKFLTQIFHSKDILIYKPWRQVFLKQKFFVPDTQPMNCAIMKVMILIKLSVKENL